MSWTLDTESLLGQQWQPICEYKEVDFTVDHFLSAMDNLIREPNINSTVIMRADMLGEEDTPLPQFPGNPEQLNIRYLDDIKLRKPPLDLDLTPVLQVVRRIIPRNPFKDYIINQSCLIYHKDDTALVVYIPHILTKDETPFYLPPVSAIGILYDKKGVSIHYIPFDDLGTDIASRPMRIALRLLQTACKHARGRKTGYSKRVYHDQVVAKVNFQNRYLELKQKYADDLVNGWCESTDPKKHVFEDLAIAAFLIEFWQITFDDPKSVNFCDLGCGNGLLVHILIQEGYSGRGIDARARKSWLTYPKEVQDVLEEKIIIPSVLLKPHPAVAKFAPHVTDNGRMFMVPDFTLNTDTYCSAASLLESPKVCTAEFPPNTFIIGNHSDEMTCWIPLLGYPFVVIPCCSHALSGAKHRFPPKKSAAKVNAVTGNSQYGALVDHVEDLAKQMGWDVKKEMLRIPSTRNAAIIGTSRTESWIKLNDDAKEIRVHDTIHMEGGAEGWVQNSVALMKRAPRGH